MQQFLEIFLITIFAFGCAGYVTTAFYREPRNIKLTGKKQYGGSRPFCDVCNHPLNFLDFVPIVNWIKNQGKCPFCGAKVDRSFLAMEIAAISPALILYFLIGLSDDYLLFYALCCLLSLAAGIDLKHKLMPERILIAIFFTGALYRVMHDASVFMLIQTLATACLLALFFNKAVEKYGRIENFSYIKFFIAASAWLYPLSFAGFLILNLIFAFFGRAIKNYSYTGLLQAISLIVLVVLYHLKFIM